jgi:hypothetical protein
MERIAPSATLEAQIADLLSQGVDDNEQLAELRLPLGGAACDSTLSGCISAV